MSGIDPNGRGGLQVNGIEGYGTSHNIHIHDWTSHGLEAQPIAAP